METIFQVLNLPSGNRNLGKNLRKAHKIILNLVFLMKFDAEREALAFINPSSAPLVALWIVELPRS